MYFQKAVKNMTENQKREFVEMLRKLPPQKLIEFYFMVAGANIANRLVQ